MLQSDIRYLKAQIKIGGKQNETVDWYIDVMEQGIDATKAMKDFVHVRDQRDALEKSLTEIKKKKNVEIFALNKRIKELEKQLLK